MSYWDARYITSPFGAPRPGGRTHRGADWSHSTRPGTPIPAPFTGTVISKLAPAAWHGFGHQITLVEAGRGRRWSFAHLASASGLALGAHISVGTILGAEGTTGTATGPCVHVELYDGGWRDPAPAIAALTRDNANTITRREETDVVFLKTNERRGTDTKKTARWYTFDGYNVIDVPPGQEQSFKLVYGRSRDVTEVTIARLRDQGRRHREAMGETPLTAPPAPTALTIELTGTATPA